MEKYLFNAYLKYMKDNQLTVWPKLLKLPWYIIALFTATFAFFAGTIISILIDDGFVTWISLLVEVSCCVVLYYFSENYRIKSSITQYSEYQNYCKNLSVWLEQQFVLKTDEEIAMMRDRINTHIDKLKAEQECRATRNDKWLQTLIIPVLLAMITAIIAKQEDTTAMITSVTAILLAFTILYSCITIIRALFLFPQNREIRHMECLASDLQGILDCNRPMDK